ncbi:hypothetical protein DPEC_G00038830 [Dallia pectoralis]|uniref:Uncharacterized protein n=1 Tax=Dallia pectoralis TaxID=75939 RepID=A0ACC2HEZ1_DALPE|nr:hypothetical protein DPEC_G00038830 [Dallia pectoralis]
MCACIRARDPSNNQHVLTISERYLTSDCEPIKKCRPLLRSTEILLRNPWAKNRSLHCLGLEKSWERSLRNKDLTRHIWSWVSSCCCGKIGSCLWSG